MEFIFGRRLINNCVPVIIYIDQTVKLKSFTIANLGVVNLRNPIPIPLLMKQS